MWSIYVSYMCMHDYPEKDSIRRARHTSLSTAIHDAADAVRRAQGLGYTVLRELNDVADSRIIILERMIPESGRHVVFIHLYKWSH
jgi:hypothetical protein